MHCASLKLIKTMLYHVNLSPLPHASLHKVASFYGGETSKGSCTVFSPAAEVSNDLGELP